MKGCGSERRIFAVTILSLTSIAFLLGSAVASDKNTYDPAVVRFAMSSSVLESDVNPDDAIAAAKIWSAKMGVNAGAWSKSEAQIFYDLPSLVHSVKTGETDVVSISTQEYLEVETELNAEPAFTYMQAGQVEIEYVLLVRKDSNIRAVADLRGKRIIWGKSGRNCLTPLWLDALLFDNNLPPKEAFFKEFKEAGKASKVIIPVFFRQIDGAIATRSAFDTAVALNPQIGQQMISIAMSPRLVSTVSCLRTDLPAERKRLYISQALKLHESPGTLQTFNIFKLDRLIRWDSRFLGTVMDLWNKQRLSRSARRGTGRPNLTTGEER